MTANWERNPCECLVVRWFLAFGTDWSIIAGQFVGIAPVKSILTAQIQRHACKVNVYTKCLILLPNIWSMIPLYLLKSLNSIESHILWKATCSQILQHFIFIPQFMLKVIFSISHSFVWKLEEYIVRTQQIFLIDRPFIRGFGYIHVPLISISFLQPFTVG